MEFSSGLVHCKLVELDASILCGERSAGLMGGIFGLKEGEGGGNCMRVK